GLGGCYVVACAEDFIRAPRARLEKKAALCEFHGEPHARLVRCRPGVRRACESPRIRRKSTANLRVGAFFWRLHGRAVAGRLLGFDHRRWRHCWRSLLLRGKQCELTDICMGQVRSIPPNPILMVNAAKAFASGRLIDSLSNLPMRRIYIFSGTEDSIVRQPAVDATVSFFQELGVNE